MRRMAWEDLWKKNLKNGSRYDMNNKPILFFASLKGKWSTPNNKKMEKENTTITCSILV